MSKLRVLAPVVCLSVALLFDCGISAAAAPAPAVVRLLPAPPLQKGIDALPLLAHATTPALQRVNAILRKANQNALDSLKDCATYTRTVQPTMLGPGYLSFWINESYDCGAYPAVNIYTLVLDLSTGQAVDWTKIVHAAGIKAYADTGADGKDGLPQALIDPALQAIYLKDPDNAISDCKDAYQDPQPFLLWPEAKSGHVVVQAFDLPHVVQACANNVELTPEQAKSLGFSPDFLAALAAAHHQPGAKVLASPGD